MNEFSEHLKKCNYVVIKDEALVNLPSIRITDGLRIDYNDNDNSLCFSCDISQKLLCLNFVLFELSDPALIIDRVSVDDVDVNVDVSLINEDDTTFIEYFVNNFERKVTIFLKDKESFNYECGCVLFSVKINENREIKLNKFLDYLTSQL